MYKNMKTTTKNIKWALRNMISTPLKIKIDAAKHITTFNKGMGMIALVQSHRGTAHVNLKQWKETNEGFKIRCGITI